MYYDMLCEIMYQLEAVFLFRMVLERVIGMLWQKDSTYEPLLYAVHDMARAYEEAANAVGLAKARQKVAERYQPLPQAAELLQGIPQDYEGAMRELFPRMVDAAYKTCGAVKGKRNKYVTNSCQRVYAEAQAAYNMYKEMINDS